MKRYLLFAFDHYYPAGGWSDFRGSFSSLRYAKATVIGMNTDRWQIVDSHTMAIVEEFRRD